MVAAHLGPNGDKTMTNDTRQMIEACTEMIHKKGYAATMEMLVPLRRDSTARLLEVHHNDVKMLALAAATLALEGLVKKLNADDFTSR